MKFTLNECLARINQVLNYPAVSYEDIYHFFDQAIEELNTNLRIALPTVSEMVSEHTFDISSQNNTVRLSNLPTAEVIYAVSTIPTSEDVPIGPNDTYRYYCTSEFSSRKFYKWNGTDWDAWDAIYGVYVLDGVITYYKTVPINSREALWGPVDTNALQDFDLTEYLPISWWTLFIIPYVSFKFAVRNGDDGNLFADEFTQGFQQLNTSYNIPNTVALKDVAGKEAYKSLVKENLDNLNKRVYVRAIFDDMRVNTGIQSVFGGFYQSGGWGV